MSSIYSNEICTTYCATCLESETFERPKTYTHDIINFLIRTKDVCDGTLNPDLIFQCGRPLGFSFDTQTDNLYIVDGVLGLYVVGPNGGQATRLASSAEGITFRFVNGLDVDIFTGIVYFTSSSTTYDIRYTQTDTIFPINFNIFFKVFT